MLSLLLRNRSCYKIETNEYLKKMKMQICKMIHLLNFLDLLLKVIDYLKKT